MTSVSDSSCPPIEALERAAVVPETETSIRSHLSECPSCAARLRSIRADNALLDEMRAVTGGGPGDNDSNEQLIPHYVLGPELHRGSQGVVYRAHQVTTNRTVAIKLLLQGTFASPRQLARFEREIELLAGLHHQHIVTIHDSGRTADGRQYLIMEYVDGVPLDTYAATLSSLPDAVRIERILRLFAHICDAVNAAHQRGIMHRDLKPANILVDADGEPHVLDFGLARRADPDPEGATTLAGEFLGTLAYAAPEQVDADPNAMDIRTDVYALGVVLFEMLTGRRPYQLAGSLREVIQTIRAAPCPPPSSHDPAIDDELNTIVLTALAKDLGRRYQSAGALLEDVRHYLANEPINAKRDSQWYVLSKTVSRYRLPVALAVALFLLSITFAVLMTLQVSRATRAEQAATKEASRATETFTSFLKLLRSDKLTERAGAETMPALIAEADVLIAEHLGDHPEFEAASRRELGLALLERGDYEFALQQFTRVRDLNLEHLPSPHPDLAESMHNVARGLWFLGRPKEAEVEYRAALDMRKQLFGEEDLLVALTMSHLGASLRAQGLLVQAEVRYRRVLELRRRLMATDADIAASLNNLGVCLTDRRQFAEARPLLEEAIETVSKLDGDQTRRVAQTHHNVARCFLGEGNVEAARERVGRSLEMKRTVYEDDHPSIARTRLLAARIDYHAGAMDDASATCQELLRQHIAARGEDHLDVANTLLVIGRIHLRRDEPDAAVDVLARSLEIRRARLPVRHWPTGECMSLLGEAYARAGRPDLAAPLLEEGHRIMTAALPADDGVRMASAARLERYGKVTTPLVVDEP